MTADPDAALREAATKVHRVWRYIDGNVYGSDSMVRDLREVEATLLAATASPGLDVERLARAHNNVMFRRGEGHGLSMEHWAEVAREYAALAADREESDIDPNAEWNTPS